jgi:hypothetical protein
VSIECCRATTTQRHTFLELTLHAEISMSALAQGIKLASRNTGITKGHYLRRCYASSRFPDRGPGGYRRRQAVSPRRDSDRSPAEELPVEDKPTIEQSDIWEQSLRRPSRNPEEGLRSLLLPNDLLVVTRSVAHAAHVCRELHACC